MIKNLILIFISIFMVACSNKTHKLKLQKTNNLNNYIISDKKTIFKPTGSLSKKTIKKVDIFEDKYFFNNNYKYFSDPHRNSPGQYRNMICGTNKYIGKLSPNGEFFITTLKRKNRKNTIWYSSLNFNDCTNENINKYNYSFGSEGIYKFDISPNNKLLAVINYSDKRKISIYNIKQGKLIKTFKIKNYHAKDIKFTPNSNGIFIIFNNGKNPLKLYDINTKKEYKIKIPNIDSNNIGYKGIIKKVSEDTSILVVKDNYDLVIINLATQSFKKFKRFFISKNKKMKDITALDISKNKKIMIIATSDKKLYLFNLKNNTGKLIEKNKLITAIKINKDNNFFITGENSYIITKWTLSK